MIPVVFRKAARLDFVAAVRWYERRRAGLGAEFALEIRRTLMAGREFPDRAPVIEAGIRRIKARRFPFYIFYRVRGGHLVVLAIFHARRNPAVWRRRL
jgi:toxin ParE1/3/4